MKSVGHGSSDARPGSSRGRPGARRVRVASPERARSLVARRAPPGARRRRARCPLGSARRASSRASAGGARRAAANPGGGGANPRATRCTRWGARCSSRRPGPRSSLPRASRPRSRRAAARASGARRSLRLAGDAERKPAPLAAEERARGAVREPRMQQRVERAGQVERGEHAERQQLVRAELGEALDARAREARREIGLRDALGQRRRVESRVRLRKPSSSRSSPIVNQTVVSGKTDAKVRSTSASVASSVS